MSCDHADWLVGGGVMARGIKAKDWSLTPLGPIESWPQSLRATVSLVQASSSPISLVWGPGHTHIYNDGYLAICGDQHAASMGQDFRECWASSFSVLGEAYAAAWAGRSAYFEKMRMFLDRFGFLEETWFTFSFSPIADESGKIGGLFHPVTELTAEMLSERRTRTLRDLATRGATAKTAEEALRLSADVFAAANLDVPFTVFYLVDEGAHRGRRVAQSGITPTAAGPAVVELGRRPSPWSIAEVVRDGETLQLDDVLARVTDPVGPYRELPKHAFVLPIYRPGNASLAGLLVAGVSARLPLTDTYRRFFELVAGTVASSLANARALEDAHRRAEELEAFSYSASHDLRAPLRAINTFTQIVLDDHAGALDQCGLDYLHRIQANTHRMTAIIDDLLVLSQVARCELRSETVDLTAIARRIVTDLRGAAPSRVVDVRVADGLIATGDAGLVTIALENLLANAWKFTAKRRAAAILVGREADDVFVVRDNGAGFDMSRSAQLFEPFGRLHAESDFEGTGIGLAIVRRVVERHGGGISADGNVGAGATIRFTLRAGHALWRPGPRTDGPGAQRSEATATAAAASRS